MWSHTPFDFMGRKTDVWLTFKILLKIYPLVSKHDSPNPQGPWHLPYSCTFSQLLKSPSFSYSNNSLSMILLCVSTLRSKFLTVSSLNPVLLETSLFQTRFGVFFSSCQSRQVLFNCQDQLRIYSSQKPRPAQTDALTHFAISEFSARADFAPSHSRGVW